MIIICATDRDEAADLAEALTASLPAAWGYRIFLQGGEYTSRYPKAAAGRDVRRRKMYDILTAAGSRGLTPRVLALRLEAAGNPVPRATMFRWLDEDEAAGKICSPERGRRAMAPEEKP